MSDTELEQLRQEVAALKQIVTERASLAEQEQEATLEALVDLEGAVAGLLEQSGQPAAEAEEEEAPEAVAWVDYATEQDWTGLCDWVDWLLDAYDLDDARRVWPCWPAHLGVAEELAALWSAWLEAASRARVADGDALAFWHDRYLTTFLARVQRLYNIGLCREKHITMRKAAPTNRTLIDVRSAAIPAEAADDADGATAGGPVLAVVSS